MTGNFFDTVLRVALWIIVLGAGMFVADYFIESVSIFKRALRTYLNRRKK
jgi:hypothetical protein